MTKTRTNQTNQWLMAVCAVLCVFVASHVVLTLVSIPNYYQRLVTKTIPIKPDVAVFNYPTNESVAAAAEWRGMSVPVYAAYSIGITLLPTIVSITVAILLILRANRNWFLWFTALLLLFYPTGYLFRFAEVAEFATNYIALSGLLWPCLSLWLFSFPNGRAVPRWALWLVIPLALVHFIIQAVALLAQLGLLVGSLSELLSPFDTLISLLLLICLACQVYRYVRVSTPIERQQTKWFVVGVALWMAPSLILDMFPALTSPTGDRGIVGDIVDELVWSFVPLSIGIAILRYRLFDINVVINRALVYGSATAAIVTVYALIVGSSGTLFRAQGSPVVAFGATGIVAVLFHPIRLRIQRAVNHLMYGQRDEPYAVLARFGRQLETTPALDTLLPTIVSTIKDTLKLPFVVIALASEASSEHSATDEQRRIHFSLKHQGQPIGALIVAPREGEATLSTTDRRLLEDLVRQAEVAIHAASVTADLQHARERLVVAREEERRRIRNDLHDGLAPTLSSLQLQLGAMRNLIRQNPEHAEAAANELREDLRNATAEVRRLVYNLRPPALDDLGLLGAIRSQAQKVNQLSGLSVTVDAPELPALPAAVEVAVFRIAHEALMNVERHAQAHQCVITLRPHEDALVLEVRDDGCGLPPNATAGVGLSSMRERAAELGGDCAMQSLTEGGTQVRARLPLRVNIQR